MTKLSIRQMCRNIAGVSVLNLLLTSLAFAEEGMSAGTYTSLGAGLAISLAAAGAAFGQGKAVSSALDAIGRNPGAESKIKNNMILGLVFMETLVIFSFVIAFMLIGKI